MTEDFMANGFMNLGDQELEITWLEFLTFIETGDTTQICFCLTRMYALIIQTEMF